MQERTKNNKSIFTKIVFVLLITIIFLGFNQNHVNAANTGQFEYDPSTKTLVIKSNFTDDDMYKLSGLDNLVEKVVFNEGVTEITSGMFEDFSNLKIVKLSDTLTYIGSSAFLGCTSLKNIVIPKNVSEIGDGAFGNCSSLKNVVILNDNISLRKSSTFGAFDNNYKPTLFCSNNSNAYKYATNSQINFPYKLIKEDENNKIVYEIDNCIILVTSNNELYIIGENLIKPLKLSSILLNENTIGKYKNIITKIIIYTSGEESIDLSSYYDTLKNYNVLSEYKKLEYFELAKGSIKINDTTYTGSIKIWDILGDKSVFAILINDEILVIADTKVDETVEMPSVDNFPDEIDIEKIKKVVISSGISTISGEMFEGFENLKSVIIPNSVKSIFDGAFKNCTNLESILIPSNVSFIGDSTFAGCEKLRDFVILSNSYTLGNKTSIFDQLDVSKIKAYYTTYNKEFNECTKKIKISSAVNSPATNVKDNIIFVISEDKKTLYLLGNGSVKDYNLLSDAKEKIETLRIGKKITSVGDIQETFVNLKNIYGYYSNKETRLLFKQLDEINMYNHQFIYEIDYYANGDLIYTQEIMNGGKLKTFSEDEMKKYKPSNEYTFVGWTTNTNSAKLEYTNGATISSLEDNIKLYDIWSRDANFYSGLDGKTNNPVKQYYNRKYYYLNLNDAIANEVNGFEKLGWRVDDVAANSAYFNGAYTQDDKDFYCVYKKNINFYYGKEKNTSETGTLYYNVKNGNYYLKTLGNSSKQGATINGWTLVGWTTNSQYTGKPQYSLNTELRNKDFSFNNNQTIEFYAIYKRNNRIQVIYYGGPGTFGSVDVYSQDQYYTTNGGVTGISTKFADANSYTKEGYIFDCWTRNGYSYPQFKPGDDLSFYPSVDSNDISYQVNANWRTPNTYTITYYMNDGTNNIFTTRTKYEDDAIMPITNEVPERENYIFKGWNTKSDGTGTFWREPYTLNENLNVYAIWEEKNPEKFEVKLDLNAPGSHSYEEIQFNQNIIQIKTKDVDMNLNDFQPTITGYNFVGWSENKNATVSEFSQNNNLYRKDEDTTLYAIWKAKTVTVHFNGVLDERWSSTQTFTYDVEGQKFSDKNWKKDGYTQEKWYTNIECDSTTSYSINATVKNSFIERNAGKTVELYAKWIENTATINYYGNDADTNKKKTDSNGKSEVTTVFNMQGSVSTNDPKWKWNLTDVSTLFEKNGYHITDNANAWIIDSAVKNGQDITDLKGKVIDQGNCYNETTGEFNLDVARNIIKEQLKTGSIEINLKANWQENAVTLKFHPEGGTVTTNGKARVKTWTDDTYTTCTQTIKYTHKNASDFDMYNVTTLFAKEGYHITNGSYPDGGTAQPNDDPKAWIWRKADGSEQVVNQKSFNCKELMEKGSVELDLYPNWQANTATISYYANGGISANEAKYPITNGKSNVTNIFGINGNINGSQGHEWNIYDVSTIFKKEGYHIENHSTAWKVGSKDAKECMDESDTKDTAKTNIQNELKTKTGLEYNLFANWVPNTYTITFDANDGKGTMENKRLKYNEKYNLPECKFTNAGYNFVGWTTEKNDETTIKKAGASVQSMTNEDNGVVTLYAYWVENRPLRVYYNVNGGTLSLGEKATNLSPTPNNEGWLLQKDGTNLYYNEVKKGATDVNLPDVNNKKFIYLTKECYMIPENQEWIVDGKNITYDQNTTYEDYSYSYDDLIQNATEVKDNDGKITYYELKLKANWQAVKVEKVTLNKTALNLDKGKTETLKVTVEPENATNKEVTWTSSNEKVATVDGNGKVTAVGAGEATITARVGIIEATCKVTVKEKTIEVTVKEDAEKVKEIKDIKEVVNDQEIIRKYIIVEPKTKAKEVIEELIINDERKLVVKNEKSDTVDETATVKTNERVTVEGDATVNIIIIVIGDVDSNGQVNFRDVIKLNNYRLKKDINEKNWNTAQKLAYKASIDLKSLKDDIIEKLSFKDVVFLNNYRIRNK